MTNLWNTIVILLLLTAAAVSLYMVFRPQRERKKERNPEEYYTLLNLIAETERVINAIQNMDVEDLGLNEIETKKRIEQKSALRNALRNCCLGDPGMREYVREYIKSVLQKELHVNEQNIDYAIHFSKLDQESLAIQFEAVYLILSESRRTKVFGYLTTLFHIEKERSDGIYYDMGEEEARSVFCQILREHGEFTYPEKLELLSQWIYAKLYGLDATDSLIYDDSIDGCSGGVGGLTRSSYYYLEEMLCNGKTKNNCYDTIFIMYQGKQIRLSFLGFPDKESLIRVVRNIYRYDAPDMLTAQNGYVFASRQDNTRITVARPPVSASWAFFLRKFKTARYELDALLSGKGKEDAIGLLKYLMQAEQNMTISGNPASGKTTLLKALVPFIDPRLAIRVAETVFETWFNELLPYRNIQIMQERGEAKIEDIINSFRRMDTDVTILGELLEPKMAGAFIEITQAGGRQSLCTLHHETVEKLIEYLRNALMVYYDLKDPMIAVQQVIQAIQFDVHMVRSADGKRYVERITEIVPKKKPVYTGKADFNESIQKYLKFSAELATWTPYEAVNILVFNPKENRYYLEHDLSKSGYERMQRQLTTEAYEEFQAFMKRGLAERRAKT